MLTACSQQARVTAVAQPTRLPDVTKIAVTTAFQTAIPMLTMSPGPTPGPYSLLVPLSQALKPGEYLAYMNSCDLEEIYDLCRLYAISMDGSVSQLLVTDLHAGKFIYNKARIALTMIYSEADQERFRIQLLDLEHEQAVEISSPAGKDCKAQDWSPDGTQLVVMCHPLGEYLDLEIGLLSIQSGEYTLLLRDQDENGAGGYDTPRWSPDGRWLSFYRLWGRGPDIVEGLYITDMSCVQEPATCQAKTRRLPVEELVSERGLAWTPESNLARSINDRIEIYNVKTRQRIRILQADPAGGEIHEMAWSPDGKWVVVNQWYAPGALLISKDTAKSVHLDIVIKNPFWITIP